MHISVLTTIVKRFVVEDALLAPAGRSDERMEKRLAMKLLIVDDNPVVLEALSDAVSFFGHEAETAKDGIDAVDLLISKRYDVVITDAEMPRLGGIKLCRFIKTHFPNVRIIGMSGSFASAEFKNAGADVCFSKPICMDQLQDAVENRSHALPH